MKSIDVINDLVDAKIIADKLCDMKKAQLIIRKYFCNVHSEAVNATIIACNKKIFVGTQYNDL